MSRDLVIIGAGGFGRQVAWIIDSLNEAGGKWKLLGYIDEDPQKQQREINDVLVLGGLEWLEERARKCPVNIAISVANPAVRAALVQRVKPLAAGFPTLIHPKTAISPYAHIGLGTIIGAGTTISANAEVGDHVQINMGCTLGHDARIEEFATVYPGVNISGCVKVASYCQLGTGCAVIQGIEIGQKSIVGAGAVVIRDVPPGVTVVGVPAKKIE